MASETEIPEYERRRLDNMKRNAAVLSSLKINSILAELAPPPPPPRQYSSWPKKTYKRSRSSLRTQGIPPSHPSGIPDKVKSSISSKESFLSNYREVDKELHGSFIKKLSALNMSSMNKAARTIMKEPFIVESLKLKSENVARIVPDLSTIRFLPTSEINVVVAGSNSGHLGFWEFNPQDTNEGGKATHLYQPHSTVVYGVSVHPFSLDKVYSCCYDGFLKSMNLEREVFDVVYSSSSGSSLYTLSQPPNDANSIYIGEGRGYLKMYDVRVGKVINSWLLHPGKINTIDINPTDINVVATASSEGAACLWDIRKMNDLHSGCKAFREFSHKRGLRSAYFSPSGSHLAITSWRHEVFVLTGGNFEDVRIVHHGHVQAPGTCSRVIWGWDDTYLYMGCRKRRVDVLSVPLEKTVCKLESPLLSSIPCQFDAHPFMVGMLAGASTQGKVFIWTGRNC